MGMSKMQLVLAAWFVFMPRASASPTALVDGSWEYRFDDSKISKAELQALLPFGENSITFVELRSDCPIPKLKAYAKAHGGWAASQTWASGWAKEAGAAVDREAEKLRPFEEQKVPKELEALQAYALRGGRLHQQVDLATIAVVEQNSSAPLASASRSVDPANACAGAIAKVAAQESVEQKYRATRFDWGSCINGQLGAFPKAAWKSFLKRYGIREVHHAEDGE
jgi:hypothetical protein